MDDHMGAPAPYRPTVAAAGPRATALGMLLRRLRRREGEDVCAMARRLGAQDLGLAPETLAAIERGFKAPPPRFLSWVASAYALSPEARAEFDDAFFLAADPFRLSDDAVEDGADATREEILRRLAAPIDDGSDGGAEATKRLLVAAFKPGRPAE